MSLDVVIRSRLSFAPTGHSANHQMHPIARLLGAVTNHRLPTSAYSSISHIELSVGSDPPYNYWLLVFSRYHYEGDRHRDVLD
ncbi:MAG: hypothetical protein AB4352_24775 [Hormoscilla sp.]